VLGVGNRLRGDDAVGCILCDLLAEQEEENRQGRQERRGFGTEPQSSIADPSGPSAVSRQPSACLTHVIDCGDTPENFVEPVAKLRPRRILVVDCCDSGAGAGEFRLFSRPELEELSYGLLSTHTLPLSIIVELLALETGATIELLGIQPERIEFGTELSPAVRAALPALVERVRAWTRESEPCA